MSTEVLLCNRELGMFVGLIQLPISFLLSFDVLCCVKQREVALV